MLGASFDDLRAAGLSGRKATYLVALAESFRRGELSEGLTEMPDGDVRDTVMQVKGIGKWTADMLLMFPLGRPDCLPVGDLGVKKGFMATYGLKALPTEEEMERLASAWRPYRSVGTYFMWQAADEKKDVPKKRVTDFAKSRKTSQKAPPAKRSRR